jgi:hypothetical protein
MWPEPTTFPFGVVAKPVTRALAAGIGSQAERGVELPVAGQPQHEHRVLVVAAGDQEPPARVLRDGVGEERPVRLCSELR